ncbi:uncharacterized protein LOC125758668 [Rhipicephalus sanguineus]|uniref:uncharacterized protein LOC125758668 n=1 Tax=Rhipicephalus sanguineus TaxID=34632 RepID=UPI0020C1F97A|nr:uncharacterized protein LOC125758668 [Rhipicephalus sanguineus]
MPGCCVPQCTTIWRRGVRMFRFPTCPNRRKRWIAQVKRDCWEPTASSRVCEAHFEDTSFEQRRQDGLKKLRPDAIPTLFSFRPLPKHRLPPKNRDAVSNVPPRHPDLSSDRVAGVQPKTASAQVSEVAPVPNVMFAASSTVEPNCASADVDTVQLSLHSGDTPSNAADSSGSASSACESLDANSVDIPADMGDARDLRIHCASLPIALVSAPASVPTTGKDTRNCQRTSRKFLVPSLKSETMHDIEKDCVLFMDEMEISQGFDHDRSLDCLFGGTTLPQSNVQVANHALVFMIVVLCLSDELLKKRGYRYLLTGRLIQDCLENIFSVVRLRKPIPSAYDLKCALKMICVSQYLHSPTSSSYNEDDSLHLADLLDPSIKAQVAQESGENEEAEELENVLLYATTAVERDILAYVGGFLLKSILKFIDECKDCKAALVGNYDKYSTLVKLKEYAQGAGKLIQPSRAVMEVLTECEEHFKAFADEDGILALKTPFASILSALRRSVTVPLESCEIHRAQVEKSLLGKYVRTRLKIHLRQKQAQRVSGQSSKTCAAVNLE